MSTKAICYFTIRAKHAVMLLAISIEDFCTPLHSSLQPSFSTTTLMDIVEINSQLHVSVNSNF